MERTLDGGCTCGQVRYRLLTAPMFVHCCHCHLCQQQTGSAFVLHAFIEADRVEVLSGQMSEFPMPAAGTGQRHVIVRCVHCGTGVWSHYGPTNVIRSVKVGTLDDPSALPPGAHIFIESKLAWVPLPPDVPSFATGYDREAVWPAESFARRQAVLNQAS